MAARGRWRRVADRTLNASLAGPGFQSRGRSRAATRCRRGSGPGRSCIRASAFGHTTIGSASACCTNRTAAESAPGAAGGTDGDFRGPGGCGTRASSDSSTALAACRQCASARFHARSTRGDGAIARDGRRNKATRLASARFRTRRSTPAAGASRCTGGACGSVAATCATRGRRCRNRRSGHPPGDSRLRTRD
jgi:hypothetical protein